MSASAAERPGSAPPEAPVALAVQQLGVRLSRKVILEDVTFALRPGEVAGLIGANGAGKTTLLRAVAGLQTPSAGRVRLAPGARVGYVPQRLVLDPDLPLRARDLVGLGLDGHRLGLPLPSRARRRATEEMLDAVDARAFADTRAGRLSGGELQRVMIAHALIGRPAVLALDEPLANLDLRSAQEVVKLLARIAREQRIAVLISAHEINPLMAVMDLVVYLAAGRAASGTVEQVVRSDVLSRLYGHHVDVLRVHGRVLVIAGTGQSEHPPHELGDAGGPPVEIV
jgi:zinc/manganese transport system ATP-binding protein